MKEYPNNYKFFINKLAIFSWMLNEVKEGNLSKTANLSIEVRGASDFSEEYSAKLELIELIVNASGLPENYVALWVDSQVNPR